MKTTYQYRLQPTTEQKLELNAWLRVCRYWYNRMLGERFSWWENNRHAANSCPIFVTSLPELRELPNYYSQKLQLPIIKKDLTLIKWSGELLDFGRVDSTVLQDVCKRVDKAMRRFIKGDTTGKRSGKPRFKTESSFKTMTFTTAKNEWIKLVRKNWLYIRLPKLGVVKVRMHRAIPRLRSAQVPEGFILKQISLTKKADGWYIQLVLEDVNIPEFTPDKIIPTWENSIGLDAVLHEDVYLATSEGEKLPSLKPLRKNQDKLDRISKKRNARKHGSRCRRKLASREAKQHQKIARSRQDFQDKTAHKLVRSGKKVFFHEDLNLKGLTKRNKGKQDETGKFLPNGQSAKSGLNKSWLDAAFGNFFKTLDYIAAKAGAVVIPQKPAYSSMILCYRNEVIFTDCSIRDYWDEELSLMVDRDINAAINLKRLGLGIFPSIKRRSEKIDIVGTMSDSTTKEILNTLIGL
ncbi:transposase [Crocosphaera sp. XPORK-15E]|uniref:RNA-guided endonuclease InsQ/TnpB family protein n=1 Tax=Crocosphaera sp. XPORK-15E TaxID=3110247 RepID=UPI002B21C598|nr:transposase [Crocosphaera sp. XPORK-15E]MEA5534987.1 transposase [Crocosphaera sp. XPORK-15E]